LLLNVVPFTTDFIYELLLFIQGKCI
jgi:hypothetical protein